MAQTFLSVPRHHPCFVCHRLCQCVFRWRFPQKTPAKTSRWESLHRQKCLCHPANENSVPIILHVAHLWTKSTKNSQPDCSPCRNSPGAFDSFFMTLHQKTVSLCFMFPDSSGASLIDWRLLGSLLFFPVSLRQLIFHESSLMFPPLIFSLLSLMDNGK